MSTFAENKRLNQIIMATYTITLDERSNTGRALLNYLTQLGVNIQKVVPKRKTGLQKALEDIEAGRVERFASVDEMIKSLGI